MARTVCANHVVWCLNAWQINAGMGREAETQLEKGPRGKAQVP